MEVLEASACGHTPNCAYSCMLRQTGFSTPYRRKWLALCCLVAHMMFICATPERKRVVGQVTLCEQLEAYMSRFATDNGDAAAAAGNGEVKQLAVPSGMRAMASKKKDELDDKYGGTGGKKVPLNFVPVSSFGRDLLWTCAQSLRRHVAQKPSCSMW